MIRCLRNLFGKPYVAFTVGFLIYCKITARQYGFGLPFDMLLLEFPLLLYLYSLLQSLLRPGAMSRLTAAIPLAGSYLLFDLHYSKLREIPTASSFSQLPELWIVLPWHWKALALSGGLLATTLLLLNARPRARNALHALPLALLIITMVLNPAAVSRFLKPFVRSWSVDGSIAHNGRFVMMIYYQARQTLQRASLSRYENSSARDIHVYPKDLVLAQQPGNVIIIVLESFLDPRLLHKVKFNESPAHPKFARRYSGHMTMVQSPVFGGGTANAEFEVLCGVPSFRSVESIEFNIFTGSPTYCMPRFFQANGYTTLSSNAHPPVFFNGFIAYQGLGFQKRFFLPNRSYHDEEGYLKKGNYEGPMFDGEFLKQHLEYLKEHTNGKPFFSYLLGMYGHTPFFLDETIQPLRITNDSGDDRITRISNQFYYRTEALAEFIEGIRTSFPHTLIVVVSDHLPGLSGIHSYRKMGYLSEMGSIPENELQYLNVMLVVEDGEPIQYPILPQYRIRDIVYDYVSDGAHCRSTGCDGRLHSREEYRTEYMRILGLAAREKTLSLVRYP